MPPADFRDSEKILEFVLTARIYLPQHAAMPLQQCTINGKSGWRWGKAGKCYPGKSGKKKAIRQGLAEGGGKLQESRMTAATATQPAAIFESTVSESSPTVDRENGVIRNVKVLSAESPSRGRVYTPRAMNDAARLYESIGVNVNHPVDRSEAGLLKDRPVEDRFGWLKDITQRNDGVYGDLHYLKSHAMAGPITEAAERNPKLFGLSHHAYPTAVTRRDGKTHIEGISRIESVDVVQNAGTTQSLFESAEPEVPEETPVPKKLKEFVDSIKADTKGLVKLKALLEDDDMAGGYAEAAMPAGVSDDEEMDPEDKVAEAFKSMVIAVIDDESLDAAGKIAKIKAILQAQEKLTGKDDDEDDEEEDDDDDGEAKESARKQREAHASELLEAAGVKADGPKVKALAALTESSDRKALVESWRPQQQETQRPTKPLRSPPATTRDAPIEKYPADQAGFLAAVK